MWAGQGFLGESLKVLNLALSSERELLLMTRLMLSMCWVRLRLWWQLMRASRTIELMFRWCSLLIAVRVVLVLLARIAFGLGSEEATAPLVIATFVTLKCCLLCLIITDGSRQLRWSKWFNGEILVVGMMPVFSVGAL